MSFSLIILIYNNIQYITDCVSSISFQTYCDYDIIFIDDHSNEDYERYVTNVATTLLPHSTKWQYLRNPENYGTVKSINRALRYVKGNYIKLLAVDDRLHDNHVLEIVNDFFVKNEGNIIISKVALCDNELNWKGRYAQESFQKNICTGAKKYQRKLSVRNKIVAVGVFFKKDFFNTNGLFDEQYRLLEDWPTWLRVLRNGEKFLYLDYVTADYRDGIGVVSNNNPIYLADRFRCFLNEVKPNRKYYGNFHYYASSLVAHILSNRFARQLLYFVSAQFIKIIRISS